MTKLISGKPINTQTGRKTRSLSNIYTTKYTKFFSNNISSEFSIEKKKVMKYTRQVVLASFLINPNFGCCQLYINLINSRGRRGRDRMVVGFTTTCAISAYHH